MFAPRTDEPARTVQRSVWQAVLLVVLVAAAYSQAPFNGFIWDDDAYVTQNSTLQTEGGLLEIWSNPRATPQYYPVVHTSFWMETRLWGKNPAGFHVVNVLLHAVAVVLLWRALLRLQVPGAWLAAAVFGLHPIEVESVAWITERKNVLSAVFYLGSALAYLRFWSAGDGPESGRRRAGYYCVALMLFVAALGSKTVTCSLPAALLLVRWWKWGRVGARDFAQLAPFFALGLILGLTTVWLEKHHVGAQGAGWELGLVDRMLIAGRAVWFYAGKLVWPAQLTFIYPRWEVSASVWWQWLFPLTAAAAVIGLWLVRRRVGRGPLTAVLFFGGTLAPALGFFDVYPFRYSFVADHFQYLAGIAIIVLCVHPLSRLPKIAWAPLLAVLGILTWHQTAIYRNLETLWRDTLAKNPKCWLAENNLGIEMERLGRTDEAISHYRRAHEIEPAFWETHKNLGNILLLQGRTGDAIRHLERALELNPSAPDARNNLGVARAMLGDYTGAIEEFRRALEQYPGDARAHVNWGNTLRSQGFPGEAAAKYREALQLRPNLATAHKNLAEVLHAGGDPAAAEPHYREVVRLQPDDGAACFNLALVVADQGRQVEAIGWVERALQLKGDYPEAQQLLQMLRTATDQ